MEVGKLSSYECAGRHCCTIPKQVDKNSVAPEQLRKAALVEQCERCGATRGRGEQPWPWRRRASVSCTRFIAVQAWVQTFCPPEQLENAAVPKLTSKEPLVENLCPVRVSEIDQRFGLSNSSEIHPSVDFSLSKTHQERFPLPFHSRHQS